MNGPSGASAERLLKQAAVVIKKLEERVANLEEEKRARSEPIAIIGIGCRFPGGANSPQAFWELLQDGRDAVSSLEARWAFLGAKATSSMPRFAGLLTEPLDRFDAAFFGISPREARSLDPQQRLLLVTAWEALEDAGIPILSLENSRTGVFLGASSTDYLDLVSRCEKEERDAYSLTGNVLSIAAGRLSYVLGLKGPCLTLDTACSSSLVAVHLACRSLCEKECELALAGGVNLILSPEVMEGIAHTQALAPDGRCKTFDAAANGFVRGEGCGLVVLKRLADAERDGDRIFAVIRGSAVNQDGRSTGLTAPNVLSQQALLREAWTKARVTASSIGYIEAHGTGTSLGDPIEMEALRAAFAQEKDLGGKRCHVGAVKTNIGHLEAAAGVAGLIKTALALHHGRIPKSLHFRSLNPRIRLEDSPLVLATLEVPWPARANEPRIAGVSAFGISGTNAHVVLEEAPAKKAPRAAFAARSAELFVLSARSKEALEAQAAELLKYIEQGPDLHPGELAWNLATTRAALEQRMAISAPSILALKDALVLAAQGQTPPGAVSGKAAPLADAKVVFVFPGQGSQWPEMGKALFAEEPAFRSALKECDRAIFAEAGFSILAELESKSSEMTRIDVVQPLLFAMSVGLAALWRDWGFSPACVIGHSMGEVAAAHVAGALTLEDAVAIICRRSRLLRRLSGRGEMAVVELSQQATEAALAGYEHAVSVAVSNSTRTTVISGEPEAITKVLARLEPQGVFCRRVKVDVASHSPQVDPLRHELLEALAAIKPQAARVPMQSTVLGQEVKGPELSAGYWVDNLRKPVQFSTAVRRLVEDGALVFIEMSPHPILTVPVTEILQEMGQAGISCSSLRRGQPERAMLLESVGALWASGCSVAWNKLHPNGGRRLPLPTYPWQGERHWLEAKKQTQAPVRRSAGGHPLTGEGRRILTQTPTRVWDIELDLDKTPWLRDHRVEGAVVLPGAAFLEMALACGSELFGSGGFCVSELELAQALTLQDGAGLPVQIVATEQEPGVFGFQVASELLGDGGAFRVHARGKLLRREPEQPGDIPAKMEGLPGGVRLTGDELYAGFAKAGIAYGPSFQGVVELLTDGRQAMGRVRLPAAAGDPQGYHFHPALLDACLQVAAGLVPADEQRAPWVPVEVGSVWVSRGPAKELFCQAKKVVEAPGADGHRLDLQVFDENGVPILGICGLGVRRLDPGPRSAAVKPAPDDRFLHLIWEKRPVRDPQGGPGRWLLLGDGTGVGAALREKLLSLGHFVVHAVSAGAADESKKACVEVNDQSAARLRALLSKRFAGEPPTAIVHLRSLEATGPLRGAAEFESMLERGCDSVLALIQALAALQYEKAPRLFLVTRGTQQTSEGSDVCLAGAPLLGLGRVISAEHRELKCRQIDLQPSAGADDVDCLLAELLADDTEEEVCWRGGERFVERLAHWNGQAAGGKKSVEIHAAATYLVTGGLGGLGLRIAAWLAERGAGHLLLLGRKGVRTLEQEAAVAALQRLGTQVTIATVDVSDRAQLEPLFSAIAGSDRPLRGIIHAAAVLDDGMLVQQNPVRFRDVLFPKALGALHLHELSQKTPLDFFVLYSSAAGLLGAPGQGNYAAANTFLDALALHRRALGLPGLSIDWGAFSGVGIAAIDQAQNDRLKNRLIDSLTPEEGLQILERLLQEGPGQMGVLKLNLRKYIELFPATATAPLFSRLIEELEVGRDHGLLLRLQEADAQERATILCEFLRTQAAQVLRLAKDKLDIEASLASLGMDSLMSLELRNRIGSALGVMLPTAILWTYPTVKAIQGWLLGGALALPGEPQMGTPPRGTMAHCLRFQAVAKPRARLFCFHGAGGSPEIFSSWPALVPSDIEVIGLWHDRGRAADKGASEIFFEEVVSLLRHFNDAPFAFCGYSAGGVLGWRIAAKLALSANGLSPLALFSVVSPTSPKWATEWMAERPGELKELLAGRNVIGYKKAYEQILQDMIVDCDFIMDMGGFPGDLLSPAPRKLSIPLVAFGGDADPLVPKEVTEGWGALTAGPFSHYILPGDHLLMVDDANIVEITRRIVLHLESTLKTSSRV